jgi:putative transposase
MANTYTQLTYHAVFAVKFRERLLTDDIRPRIFEYISGVITHSGYKSLAVNGYRDHVHVLFGAKPNQCLSDAMQLIKGKSSQWINDEFGFRGKFRWQEGYGGFTCSQSHRHNLIRYIMNQEEHHRRTTFQDEYIGLLDYFEIPYEDRYLFEFFPEVYAEINM